MDTWASLRSKLLFLGGMAALWFELLFRRPPDLVIIPMIAGMLGLESFLSRDNKGAADAARNDDGCPPHPPAPPAPSDSG